MKGAKSKGALSKADSKLNVKKAASKGKAAKDPNKPKRPASAYLMEDFRKQIKEENPETKSVASMANPIINGIALKQLSELLAATESAAYQVVASVDRLLQGSDLFKGLQIDEDEVNAAVNDFLGPP